MDDDYIDYISFRNNTQNTILKSSVVMHESFSLNPADEKVSSSTTMNSTVSMLSLVDISADEFNSSILAYDTRTHTWTYGYNPHTCILYMIYRHQIKGDNSCLWIGEVDLINQRIVAPICLFSDPYIHYEDPRMFVVGRELYVSYSRWGSETIRDYNEPESIIQIEFTHVKYTDAGFTIRKSYIPPFGNNYTPGKVEKNWGFFEKNKELYCLYSISPFVVFKYNMETNLCTVEKTLAIEANISLRGGTPPIYVNGFFVTFIHCSDYFVYVLKMAVDKKQWSITYVNDFPLLTSLNTQCTPTDSVTKNDILFPCGAVYDIIKEQYIISMGYKDKNNVIAYINA